MISAIKYRLGDVCEVLNGKAYTQEELLNSGKYKVLRVGNFFSNGNWYYSDLELDENKYCYNGDLLFAWSASFGPRIWNGNKTIYHYHIWKLIVDKEKLDNLYLYYYLKNITQSMLGSTHGSIMLHLTKSYMENLILLVHQDIKSQKKISKVLSILDAKIELNNKINVTLESISKTLYDYWFVQFDFPDDSGKPFKTSGGKMVWSEELKREIPAGWDITLFSDWISNDKSGDWGRENIEGNYTERVHCIRGADINGMNGTGELKPPVRYIFEKNMHKILEPYDLIVEISGGSPTQSTGRLAYVTSESLTRFDAPIICSNFCKAVTLKDKSLFYNFVFHWKAIYDAGVLFGYEGKTSGIKNLLFDSFVSSHYTVLPNNAVAKKFYNVVNEIEIKRQKNLKENQKLVELRDWLLPMLMNGQVKVN